MKLSIISPNLGEACFLYRGHPFTRLPIEYRLYDGSKGFTLHDAIMFGDAVLMCRPFTAQQVEICKVIKGAGKALIIDFDDNYACLPSFNPNKKAFDGCLPNLQAMMKEADAVTVSSQALVDAVTAWGAKKAVLVKNAIDDSFKSMVPKQERSKTLLWRGGPSHSGDLYAGRETFKRMNKTHEIVFVGAVPDFAYELRHKHVPTSDYAAYLVAMNNVAPEYVYVPLVDCPFNHAKSDCAASEAYLIGAKLIHSNFGEFAGLPETGTPRWLSDVNHLRMEVLNGLFHSSRAK